MKATYLPLGVHQRSGFERTTAAKRFKQVANATTLIWQVLMVAERRFRRLNAPELLGAVAAGQRCVDGQFMSHRRAVA